MGSTTTSADTAPPPASHRSTTRSPPSTETGHKEPSTISGEPQTASPAGWRGLIRCSMTLCGRPGEVAGECLSGEAEGGRLGRASVGEPDDEGPAGSGP